MASSSTQRAPLASSMSSTDPRWKYDVFLSFRGEDTRKNFSDHLYTALKQRGIFVFRDDEEIDRGREISPKLVRAIEESRFSIIVFSENYADSTWCLDELAKIMDCTITIGQIAFPIFYNVDPSDVRKQRGSYGRLFCVYERPRMGLIGKVRRWREALSQAANLSGWDSRDRYESEFIKEIVEEVFRRLNYAVPCLDDNFVGMDFHLKQMSTRLATWLDEVKFVGVYGLGGIGKTTIAKSVYKRISNQFEGCSFLADVRESSQKHGLVTLQSQLLRDIVKVGDLVKTISNVDQGSDLIKSRLCHKRVLVVLDDVDHIDQLEKLAGNRRWFGSGSRIIITTRDEHLLDAHGVVERYKVSELDQDKSLELFIQKAFKHQQPTEDYMELSRNVVNYAQGLPLALKVLGSSLCGRSEAEWRSELDNLKMYPDEEITDKLKISYDGLKHNEKKIFLDVAFYFKWYTVEYVTEILDACGLFGGIGIRILAERSLVTLSRNHKLLMHDLVQDMGLDIVHQESPKDPGKWSRLRDYEDIRHVLEKIVGTEAVEAIMLEHTYKPNEYYMRLNAEAFDKMYNLRLLKIHKVHLPQGLSNLPNKLRVLDWYAYPLEYLPSSYQPDKLVELNMSFSSLLQLWKGIKVPTVLKFVDLSASLYLTEIPDFTLAPNLERLILDHCFSLSKLHPSVMVHKRLNI